jgi:hypothetical protein
MVKKKLRIQFDARDREDVLRMAQTGMRPGHIATVKNVPESVLRKKCATELAQGTAHAVCNVVQKGYEMATSGRHPSMTIFYLKNICGFTEAPSLEEPKASSRIPKITTKDPVEAAKIYQQVMMKD